jgi:hypothetical protein
VELMNIKMSLEKDIYVGIKKNVTILGVPIKYSNEEVDSKSFHFQDLGRINEFEKIEKSEENDNEVIFKVNIDLRKVINIYDYFTISDILAIIGGYKALAGPVLAMFFPLLTLSYLHNLSRIIKQHKIKEYLIELKKVCFDLFIKLKNDNELLKKII